MPSQWSSNLRIELINPGEQGNTWGNTTNTNLGTIIDSAVAGSALLTTWVSNVCTLSVIYGGNDQSRCMTLIVAGGSLSAAGTISVPAIALPSGSGKVYVVINQDSFPVTIKTGSTTGVTIAAGTTRAVVYNGADFVDASNSVDKLYLYTDVTSASASNQAATKAYVDGTAGNYLPRVGGSGNNMTGALYLSGSTYVADAVAASQGFVNGKTIALATSTGNISAVSGLVATGTFASNNLTLALAPATATNLGGVKQGTGCTIAADGTLNVSGGGGGGVTAITAGSNITTSGATGNVTIGVTSGSFLAANGTATNSSALGGVSASGYVTKNSASVITASVGGGSLLEVDNTGASGTGVYARSTGTSSTGVYGEALLYGVYATSSTGYGLRCSSTYQSAFFASTAVSGAAAGYANNAGSGSYIELAIGSFCVQSNYNSSVPGNTPPSDRRLKENDQPIANGLATINSLRPVTFNWKSNTYRVLNGIAPSIDYGFIAQEVEEVLPEIVAEIATATTRPDDDNHTISLEAELGTYKGMDYVKLVPFLTAAIQELSAKVDSLTAEVNTLKGN